MSSHSNSIILRYKNKTKKLGFRQKLSADDLSYLIANHFDIKGKILGLKDTSDNFYKIDTFCSKNAMKSNEVYHVIVDCSDIPQQIQSNSSYAQQQQQSSARNSSIHQHSDHIVVQRQFPQQQDSRYQNSHQSHHKNQPSSSQQQQQSQLYNIPNQHGQLGLSSMVTIVNNFKMWEDTFQDPQQERTSVVTLVEDRESIHSNLGDPILNNNNNLNNNSLVNAFNLEWVNVINSLVDTYGDRVDYFCCSVKNKEEIHSFKVFPSIIVYKGGQKVMEISLQNQTKTILRLLERFLNSASGMVVGLQQSQLNNNFGQFQHNLNHPQALLLMEQSVQQTEFDTGDIITIPANTPDQRELLNFLDIYLQTNQITMLDYYIFRCRILEKFDLFMTQFYETYSDFDSNSFKDFILSLAVSQNGQDKQDADSNNISQANKRPQSTAQPAGSGARRTPSRQQTSNFGSDSKLGFSQVQLMNAVIELETCNLLEMPILSQIKSQILAEKSEIISIIEGYLSNSYNKNVLSDKLKKAITQTNNFDRPTSPWPKREKIVQMFENIVQKQLLTKKEEDILRVLIETNNQLLMGTFSDGRLQDELVKSLKRIAQQYLKSTQSDNNQNSQHQMRNQNQSADFRGGINKFDAAKVNNFFQQQQEYQHVMESQDEQGRGQSSQENNKKEYFNKKLDFQSGENYTSQDELQFNSIPDQYSEIQGSDHKQKRTQQQNNAHQSSSSSAQFATLQRQILSASPVDHQIQKSSQNNQPHFRGDDNQDSPLHTIQLHQQLNQLSGGGVSKQTNALNIISSNNNNKNRNNSNDFVYNQSDNYPFNQNDNFNKKLEQITNSQQQSNEDLQIFNQNVGSSKESNYQNYQQAQQRGFKESYPNTANNKPSQSNKMEDLNQMYNKFDNSEYDENGSGGEQNVQDNKNNVVNSKIRNNNNKVEDDDDENFEEEEEGVNQLKQDINSEDQNKRKNESNNDLDIDDNDQNEDTLNSANVYLEFMDDYIDQFSPEDFGMTVYLINQQNEDILQLFEEIIQLTKTQSISSSLMPIKIMASSKFKEVMSKNFKSDEISTAEANKNVVTTSIFAVYQSFRVICDLDQFLSNLRIALNRDQSRKYSNDESVDESNSNRQGGSIFKSYQDKIHPDEVLQESNAISPIDQSLSQNQQYIQDNQPSFSNQQNCYQQSLYSENIYVQKPIQQQQQQYQYQQYQQQPSYTQQQQQQLQHQQQSAEFSYKRQEPEQTFQQDRVSNSAAKKSGLISLHNAQSETEITLRPITNESSDSSIRKRLRTESLQVETNAKFSPRNKKQQSQRQQSPDRLESVSIIEKNNNSSEQQIGDNIQISLTIPKPQSQSHFGLINLKKLQQIDVKAENTGMNVQDNDLNEILSNEINEFYCSYIYNENDRIYDEIINLSTTGSNPLLKKTLEVFGILYQVNDLDIVDIIEEYKVQRNLHATKEKLISTCNNKKRSTYSTIQSVNNKIGKFNLFKRLLRIIENQYRTEKVDFLVQQYLFLHDDVVTLAAFEAYCINKNWREFVENLILIGKMSLIKFNLNQTEISKLNQSVLDQLLMIYAYGRYLRSEHKKDLEIIIKQEQGSQEMQKILDKYELEEIDQQQFIDGICQYSKDISISLRKEEYIQRQKYSCPSIEERDELKRVVERLRNDLSEREIMNLDVFNQLIAQANKNLLGALALFDYNNDREDFIENLCLIYHYETSNDMKRIIKEFARLSKWDSNQAKFLEQQVDEDEPVLMGAYYHYKKNESDKQEKQELMELFEIFLNQRLSNNHH